MFQRWPNEAAMEGGMRKDQVERARIGQLSASERYIIARIAEGASDPKLAEELGRPLQVVKSRLRDLVLRLGFPQVDRVQLAVWAVRAGLDKDKPDLDAARRDFLPQGERPDRQPRRTPASAAVLEVMPLRERQVLARMMQGRRNKQIALELGIAAGTVKVYAKSLFRRIGVLNRSEAASWAARNGVLLPET
jgi:DNA-binding NarL/FixJ family response regulator